MNSDLSPATIDAIGKSLRKRPAIVSAKLFGSRAMGNHRPGSDVDLALFGQLSRLDAEIVAGELEELPYPFRFDVHAYERIKLPALRDHIDRVGVEIYRLATPTHPSSPNTARE